MNLIINNVNNKNTQGQKVEEKDKIKKKTLKRKFTLQTQGVHGNGSTTPT